MVLIRLCLSTEQLLLVYHIYAREYVPVLDVLKSGCYHIHKDHWIYNIFYPLPHLPLLQDCCIPNQITIQLFDVMWDLLPGRTECCELHTSPCIHERRILQITMLAIHPTYSNRMDTSQEYHYPDSSMKIVFQHIQYQVLCS